MNDALQNRLQDYIAIREEFTELLKEKVKNSTPEKEEFLMKLLDMMISNTELLLTGAI